MNKGLGSRCFVWFLILGFHLFLHGCATAGSTSGSKQPTAIVLDDETGKPIQGAVAIAVWAKYESTMFEGPIIEARKIEEAVSDKEGKIFIKGFWTLDPFHQSPRMTIYKPGYVCWDQKLIIITNPESKIYSGTKERDDFNRNQRVAKMVKYPEGFSYLAHSSFIGLCVRSFYGESRDKLFLEAYRYETPFRVKERDIRNKKRRKLK
ncbi:hypothetical protein QUF70_07535 [Desulfobacterales bacterium HSG17]|nr:hypothetical protein [Desulfobacterales bacterium HSG17]